MDAKLILDSLGQFEKQKEIPKEVVINSLKEALSKAYKKSIMEPDALCEVKIDTDKGEIKIFKVKEVVEEVEDDLYQIDLKEAKEKDSTLELGDLYIVEKINVDDLSRVAARQALQVLTQKIREYEKKAEYEPYIEKKDEIITGVVDQVGIKSKGGVPEFVSINVGKTKAILRSEHIIPGEEFKRGEIVKVYVVDVDKNAKGAPVIVSRTHPGFLRRLFESEIHEVYDGTVEIKHIVRHAGDRAKVSVFSRNKNVDSTGACIGPKGIRIQKISNMLMKEKIDVIDYFKDPVLYIEAALRPASVIGVKVEDKDEYSQDEMKRAIAVVDDEDFSLAIGKKGINARLAVKLTGYSIDIKTISQAQEEEIVYKTVEQAKNEYETEKMLEEQAKKEKRVRKVVVKKEEPKEIIETKEKESQQELPKKEKKEEIKPRPKIDERKLKEIVTPKEKPKPRPKRKPKKDDEDNQTKRTVTTSKEVEELKKKRDKARSTMPVYDEKEIDDLDDDLNKNNDFYDDIDLDDFDDYYEE